MLELTSASPDETFAIGRRLAGLLQPGDIVLLCGRLGSGKTLLTAGIADGLGIDDRITSPSFVLVRHYDGFLPLVHADVYRLGTSAEFADLELVDTAEDGVLVIEWGDAVAGGVPPDHLTVRLEMVGEAERSITFVPRGAWTERNLEELRG